MCGRVVFAIALEVSSVSWAAVAFQGDRDGVFAALRQMSHPSAEMREQGLKEVSERIRAEEAVRDRPDVQLALAALLRAEQRRITDHVATHGSAEDYRYLQSYQEELLPAALAVLPHAKAEAERELVAALVNGAFTRGSAVARAIAAVGEGAVSAVLERATSSAGSDRYKGYDLLGEMLGYHRAGTLRHPLSSRSEAQARRALLAGLGDSSITCRRNAIRGVVKAREHSAIPALKVLAATDPDDGRTGYARSSVRALAAQAIATLSATP